MSESGQHRKKGIGLAETRDGREKATSRSANISRYGNIITVWRVPQRQTSAQERTTKLKQEASNMAATMREQTVNSLEIVREEEIAAPIGVVFETILEQMGPENEAPGTGRVPMKLEAWPGGRWYRDLGDNAGHFWGNVQAIKPPTLLEIWGPLFMSHPAVSNVQYRLSEENGITRVKFMHRAMGQITQDARIEQGWSQIEAGWDNLMARIRSAAQQHSK
jgi:uncharacterized protein YndB with AHSA1/START domain